jgi:glycosyltransferase 2 family protein
LTHTALVASQPRRALHALLKPRRKLALKIVISATLVAWLVYSTDRDALADALLEVDLSTALLAVIVLFALIAIQAWRWTLVARALDISFPLVPAWLISQIGAFFNQVLPSSIGGDAMRVWRLQRSGVRTSLALASVFLDRVVALVGTILIVVVGLPWLLDWMDTDALRAGILAVVLVAATGVAVLLFADRAPLVHRLAGRSALARVLQVPALARRVLFTPQTAFPTLALSVVIHLGVALSVWLLAYATGVELTWAETAFLVPVVILFSMVPITIAGWGVREGAMVVALGTVGVGREEALAVSVLFGIASAVAALPGGLIWLATGRSSAVDGTSHSTSAAA